MSKKLTKVKARDAEKAARVKKTAKLTGVTTKQVYRVINGDQKNEAVLLTYMEFSEGENLLLEAVKRAVPFK